MLTWYTTNLLLTMLAWLFLWSNGDSPHRLRFVACIAALCAWLVPWPLVGRLWPAQSMHELAETVMARLPLVPKDMPVFAAYQWLDAGLMWITAIGLCSGVLVFIRNWRQQRALVQTLTATSSPAGHLWKVLDASADVRATLPKLRLQRQLPGALTTGIRTPIIWLHEDLQDSPVLAAVLQHELRHVRQRDNAYLWLVTLIEALFWWNFPVRRLGGQARELLELSCDEACARQTSDYRLQLNQLIVTLASHPSDLYHPPLSSAMFNSSKFNVRRIQLLKRSYSMKIRHYLNTMLSVSVATLGIGLALAQPAPQEQAADNPAAQSSRTQAEILAGLEVYAGNMEQAYTELAEQLAALQEAHEELQQTHRSLLETQSGREPIPVTRQEPADRPVVREQ